MTVALIFAAALSMGGTLRGVFRARGDVRHTTLTSAWRWAMTAVIAWGVVWCLEISRSITADWLDPLWYGVALLAVCPPIAVLGARRPGAGVWTAFVVLPLLAVLGWPLLTLWASGGELRSLRLETPQLLGFVLVLLMGAGNYLGTRFSLSGALYVVALCLVVAPVSAVAPTFLQDSSILRQLATICLGLAVYLAQRRPAASGSREPGIVRLWLDYRNLFGIVWAKRFQDRLNGIAQQQHWPARLSDRGIHWSAASPVEGNSIDTSETEARVEQTFRWLLRRFVDPEWINERLATKREVVDCQNE